MADRTGIFKEALPKPIGAWGSIGKTGLLRDAPYREIIVTPSGAWTVLPKTILDRAFESRYVLSSALSGSWLMPGKHSLNLIGVLNNLTPYSSSGADLHTPTEDLNVTMYRINGIPFKTPTYSERRIVNGMINAGTSYLEMALLGSGGFPANLGEILDGEIGFIRILVATDSNVTLCHNQAKIWLKSGTSIALPKGSIVALVKMGVGEGYWREMFRTLN